MLVLNFIFHLLQNLLRSYLQFVVFLKPSIISFDGISTFLTFTRVSLLVPFIHKICQVKGSIRFIAREDVTLTLRNMLRGKQNLVFFHELHHQHVLVNQTERHCILLHCALYLVIVVVEFFKFDLECQDL
jgi:hypothetical protein